MDKNCLFYEGTCKDRPYFSGRVKRARDCKTCEFHYVLFSGSKKPVKIEPERK
jgi:hypothetical protein